MYSFNILHEAITSHGKRPFCDKENSAPNDTTSWQELQRDYLILANEFKKMGLSKSPVVAILSGTRYEWNVADLAIQAASGITVGLYKNDRDNVIYENLKQTKPELLIVENYDDFKRIQVLDSDWGWHKPVIIMDANFPQTPPVYHLGKLLSKPLSEQEQKILECDIKKQPEDRIASHVFTSGTGGTPKATALSIKNLIHTASVYRNYYDVNEFDNTILYLPFSHVFSRVMFYSSLLWGQKHTYVSNIENLAEQLKQTNPTILLAVPRVLEKVKKAIEAQVQSKGIISNLLFRLALIVGKQKNLNKSTFPLLSPIYNILDKIVLKKLRAAFGTRIKFMGAGGGKLSESVAQFFWSMGIPIYEGYASTESGGLGIFNHSKEARIGLIGKPINQVDVKIAEDGELLLKSPSNAQGYLVNGKIEPFDKWIKTGDIVEIEEDGFIKIVDRKKDIMVTAYGKNIAPSWIEEQFNKSLYIEDIVIFGDDKPFISALVVPSENIQKSENAITIIQKEIDLINNTLSRHESVRAFTIIPAFDVDSNTLTATFKKRRTHISKHYHHEIEAMYTSNNHTLAISQS